MSYGLNPHVFIEDGPAVQVAEAKARHSTARAWKVLDEARRLAIVERALAAANDCIDDYPLAI
jgi:hypothetical protein